MLAPKKANLSELLMRVKTRAGAPWTCRCPVAGSPTKSAPRCGRSTVQPSNPTPGIPRVTVPTVAIPVSRTVPRRPRRRAEMLG